MIYPLNVAVLHPCGRVEALRYNARDEGLLLLLELLDDLAALRDVLVDGHAALVEVGDN